MASSSFPSSSSSSSVPPRGPWAYDVFLSFRGEDTRNNFVDHLYEALDRNGLTVFKDDKMLRVGKEISPELMKAIKESTCTVVVFSKNYANSSWCLAELTKVMECHNQNGRLVIPVFYHVNPTDVRGQKGRFEIAFKQHEEKFKEEMDVVKKWREVLQSAANLSGHHISKEQAEASFITKIVRDIQGNIPFRGMEKDHIGIVSHINKLKSLLDLEAKEEVRMIGIWGMGGIGKTTIARALFREIRYKFDGSSFVEDVREKYSNGRDICVLQKQIVKQIAHYEAVIKDVGEGTERITKIFQEKKILLVLDDVDDVRQLEVLGAIPEWFGKGSRIIITTRDSEFLVDANDVYSPDLLPMEHAVELFSWHAFRKNSPPEGYEDLSNRAIGYTCGLPLALRVLGCFFHGKRDTDEWESHLNRLDQAKNNGSSETPLTHEKNGIMETFKISFDGLYEYEKHIFLDIACFFKGKNQKNVTEILDCSGLDSVETGIKALIRKSLITVSDEQINMHDVLQEMGLEILRKSYPNTRLCRIEEIRYLKKNNNLETVTAIIQGEGPFKDDYSWMFGENKKKKNYDELIQLLIGSLLREAAYRDDGENVRFSGEVFENMNNLRLLQTWGFFTSCEPTTFPDKLGWLHWNQYPFSSLPVANMRQLVSLKMHQGEINHLWSGYEYMPNLKAIYLGVMNNITSLPDVSGAVNLKKLELVGCNNLVEIHKSLGTLKNLAYLSIIYCKNLPYLPSLEEMPALDTIELTRCSALERFPEVSSSMVRLSNIRLDGCSNLKNIPNSICKLKNLEILNLQSCGSLQDLPEELGSMGKLEKLLLGFEDIPDSINLHALTKLCCLRKLDLSGRQMEEQDFPKNFHEFSSLKELHLSGNLKLVQLPRSISRLSSLTHLELNDCHQLQNIQGLPSGIQVLKAVACTSLKKIEDLSKEYTSLHTILLAGCKTLLKNDENKAYLDEMLQESFVKKCIAVDGQLSIWIPGSKIPRWRSNAQHPDGHDTAQEFPSGLEEQQYDGYEIALKLPPQRHTSIMGFVVWVVFQRMLFGDDGISAADWIEHEDKDNGISAASPADWNELGDEGDEVSMVYIPESVFWGQMYDGFGKGDWSLLVESGRSVSIIVRSLWAKVRRCGADIVYKEDMEYIQQIRNHIPAYCDSKDGTVFVVREYYKMGYGIEFKVRSIR